MNPYRIAVLAVTLLLPLILAAQDKNISGYSFYDAEPYLAVDPTDSSHLIAAWMKATGLSQVSIATKVSTDGGLSWSAGTLIPHQSPGYTSADPSIAFNSKGEVFLVFIDTKTTKDSGGVFICKSTDGGLSWGNPAKVTDLSEKPDLPVDRPWIAIDNSGGPRDGYIYITSKTIPDLPCPCDIWMKVSPGNGTWSSIRHLDQNIPQGPQINSMAVPAVGADGAFYYTYYSYDTSLNPFVRLVLGKSTDGGQTFTYSSIASFTSASAGKDSLYQASYTLSAHPDDASSLIATWTDSRNGDPDIYYAWSSNAGSTWSAPLRLNDDATGNGAGQDMCWASFGEGGRFVAAWRDRRDHGSGSQTSFGIYYAVSVNKGVSFLPNKKISSAASPFINIQRGNDFLGTGTAGSSIYALWVDQRDGNTEIYFARDLFSENTTDITEKALPLRISVQPNPFSSSFTLVIESTLHTDALVEVYDMEGSIALAPLILRLNPGENRVILGEDLKAGAYQVTIEAGEKEYTSRIVKH
jgi:hypothetical protein